MDLGEQNVRDDQVASLLVACLGRTLGAGIPHEKRSDDLVRPAGTCEGPQLSTELAMHGPYYNAGFGPQIVGCNHIYPGNNSWLSSNQLEAEAPPLGFSIPVFPLLKWLNMNAGFLFAQKYQAWNDLRPEGIAGDQCWFGNR